MQILIEDIIETNLTATIINFNWRLYLKHIEYRMILKTKI